MRIRSASNSFRNVVVSYCVGTIVIAGLSGMACAFAPTRAKADDAGQVAFNNACRTCHMTKEGDNRLGPSLYKIVGRKAGALAGYAYSSAMKQANLVWDEDKLDQFIADPDQVVPGHNMKPFGGLSSSDDRAAIIGFLLQQD